ncbi:MAG: pyridoxine 5'-phosphate synthase [Opitutaceae bacterium]|nr:pyridoxine 5'-phosphate synthase [Opitutaceae bacterium]
MTCLSINLNKIALLRNARGRDFPNVIEYAEKSLRFGAAGVTIHPRPDERHARYSDAHELAEWIKDHPGKELNIEGNPTPDFLAVVNQCKPHQCTLVPDDPNQLTSDHGWDLFSDGETLRPILEELHSNGIRTSIFLDPDKAQVDEAKKVGTDRIELYTESFASSFGTERGVDILKDFSAAALHAQKIGLGVNAGHDLDLKNLSTFLQIPSILEVSIGHALIVEAIDMGFEQTVRSYIQVIEKSG